MQNLPQIQREILRRLALAPSLRYSELQPDDVDGNLHTYHLKALATAGLVKKEGTVYSLTVTGRQYVGTMSTATSEPRVQPKITTMLAIQNDAGKYILFRWNRHPFLGKVSLPYGKLHLGESVIAGALRELDEKTGITLTPERIAYRGTTFIRAFEENTLLNHMEAHVFVGSWNGEIEPEAALGECFWGVLDDIPADERCPGFAEIMGLLEGGEKFFEEI
jgi:ADP-ribose pyrophosphatase YjhB (NUDIX family)